MPTSNPKHTLEPRSNDDRAPLIALKNEKPTVGATTSSRPSRRSHNDLHSIKKPKRNWRQFFRYLLVGGGSVLLEYGAFFILLTIYNVHYLIANSMVYVTVSAINFILNRQWTFRSNGKVGRQIMLTLGLLLFNFVASNLMLYILSGQLHIPPLWAKIAVTAMVVLWNFVLYKKVIYR